MPFCNACEYWEKNVFTRAGDQFGVCQHPVAGTQVIQDRSTKLNDETILYTAAFFGCPHHSKKSVLCEIKIKTNDQDHPAS